jgi:hypothetical protein
VNNPANATSLPSQMGPAKILTTSFFLEKVSQVFAHSLISVADLVHNSCSRPLIVWLSGPIWSISFTSFSLISVRDVTSFENKVTRTGLERPSCPSFRRITR